MNVAKFFNVLVVGGTTLAAACSTGKGGDGTGGTDATSGDTGDTTGSGTTGAGGAAGSGGAPGTGGAPGVGGAGGAPGTGGGGAACTCTAESPVLCNGVCCMWMFGADAPCCDKL